MITIRCEDCLDGCAVCSSCERCLLCSAACFLQVATELPSATVDCADCEEPTLVCCDLIESRRWLSDELAMVLGRVAKHHARTRGEGRIRAERERGQGLLWRVA